MLSFINRSFNCLGSIVSIRKPFWSIALIDGPSFKDFSRWNRESCRHFLASLVFSLSSQIYAELKPGDNSIHLSTLVSDLTFTLIFCPESNAPMTVRLGSISSSDHSQTSLEHICKQFLFLTKLVRCTFDEILCKQLGSARSLLFHVEKKFHHLTMSGDELAPDSTNQDIFKEIYGQISTTDLIEDPSVKLIVHSSIAPSNTFAYSQWSAFFSNVDKRVRCFHSIWLSIQECGGVELSRTVPTSTRFVRWILSDLANNQVRRIYRRSRGSLVLVLLRGESLFYLVGAYLHELGHLLGLDHGLGVEETIMSSSKGYIASGQDFFLTSPRLCSIVLNRQCSCYRVRWETLISPIFDRFAFQTPVLSVSSSYSNGLLRKTCQYFQSSCRSGETCPERIWFRLTEFTVDTHCQCTIRFNHHQYNQKPNACLCNGQFHFEIDHCRQLKDQFHRAIKNEKEAISSLPALWQGWTSDDFRMLNFYFSKIQSFSISLLFVHLVNIIWNRYSDTCRSHEYPRKRFDEKVDRTVEESSLWMACEHHEFHTGNVSHQRDVVEEYGTSDPNPLAEDKSWWSIVWCAVPVLVIEQVSPAKMYRSEWTTHKVVRRTDDECVCEVLWPTERLGSKWASTFPTHRQWYNRCSWFTSFSPTCKCFRCGQASSTVQRSSKLASCNWTWVIDEVLAIGWSLRHAGGHNEQ